LFQGIKEKRKELKENNIEVPWKILNQLGKKGNALIHRRVHISDCYIFLLEKWVQIFQEERRKQKKKKKRKGKNYSLYNLCKQIKLLRNTL